MGREAKINGNLTKKQLIFVNNVLNGKSATQAALAAYNTSSPQVASSIAHENLSKPVIKEAINEVLSTRGLSLSVLVSELGKLATSHPVKVTAEVQLKALIEILKLKGDYYQEGVYHPKQIRKYFD